MNEPRQIKPVTWDKVAFGFDCFEIVDPDAGSLQEALTRPGHYTVKVDPLADKAPLQRHGFYYCDSLIEPWCTNDRLIKFMHGEIAFATDVPVEAIAGICRNAFLYSRFHRDFNIDRNKADNRYENWLQELHRDGRVYGLLFQKDVAGFIAHSGGKLVLHAMSSVYRGKGLAKYFWSMVCQHLFDQGQVEIQSSVSCANLPVVNLYASLGFRFRKPVDVYHRMVP